MKITYKKQFNRIGHFASIEIEVINNKNLEHLIIDNCNWRSMNRSHSNFIIGKCLINFKESVLEGMRYGLTRITSRSYKKIELIDIIVLNTDSSIASMFVVGVKSIFSIFEIEFINKDHELIDKFVSNYYRKNDINFFKELKLMSYNQSEI